MATRFDNFESALRCFREDGGAMRYDNPYWYVGGCAEIREAVTCSALEATHEALRRGGMGPLARRIELSDWMLDAR